jgi:hypothetical protein
MQIPSLRYGMTKKSKNKDRQGQEQEQEQEQKQIRYGNDKVEGLVGAEALDGGHVGGS